jgi:hypothetical protein
MEKKTFATGKPISITLGPDVRFLWPYVFEKRVNDEDEDKYEVLIQIPYSNKKAIALFEDAIDAAIDRGYSGELSDKSTFKKGTKESALKLPLKDGEDKGDTEYADLFRGYMFCTVKTRRRPVVLDANGQQILDPEEFYSGAIGAVSVTVFPYNNRAQGVGVQLNHIMKLEEGERIGGGVIPVEEAFAEYMESPGSGSRSGNSRNTVPAGHGESRSGNRDSGNSAPRAERSARRARYSEGSDDPVFD